MIKRVELAVRSVHNKMRLEDFLLGHFDSLSKMYLRDLVKDAQCEVNGRHENIGFKLRENDFVEIVVDSARGTAMRPENIALDIVFEDDEIIVVNKPAGMLVHPSHRENSGTLINAVVYHLNKELLARKVTGEQASLLATPETAFSPIASTNETKIASESKSDSPRASKMLALQSTFIRPGLPHRLDRQTSGLIVITKTARAHRIMSGHFMKKRVEKRYLALVDGIVHDDEGTIEAPIGRFAELKLYGVKEGGKPSESKYHVRERFTDTTLLELEPVTGRTNQLRIHCELIGHPIVGDTARGGREFERLCLHAYKLAFPHPVTRIRMEFQRNQEF